MMEAAPLPRLLTIGTNDPAVLPQPWEMMRDRRGPLAFQGVTVRRQLQGARPTRRFRPGPAPARALIVSRPDDAGFINPRVSTRHVLDALDALPPGQAEVDFCEPPTLARLEEMISEARRAGRPYHIVHFDGHGTYLPRTGVGALCFENEEAQTDLVAARSWATCWPASRCRSGHARGLPQRRPLAAPGLWLGGPGPAGERRGQRGRL